MNCLVPPRWFVQKPPRHPPSRGEGRGWSGDRRTHGWILESVAVPDLCTESRPWSRAQRPRLPDGCLCCFSPPSLLTDGGETRHRRSVRLQEMQDELPHSAGSPQAHPRGALQGVPPLPHVWEDLQRPLHAGAAHGDPRWREALQLWDLQQGLPGDRALGWERPPHPYPVPSLPSLRSARSPRCDDAAAAREGCGL